MGGELLLNPFGRFHRTCLCLLGSSLLIHTSFGYANSPQTERQRVTVSDAIRMRTWANRGYFFGGAADGPVGQFSPDGTKFVILVRRGNLERNTNEYSLLLFHTKHILEYPKENVLLTMSSSSNREAIENVKWLNDNETVAFVGENPGETPEVYTLNVSTRHLEKVTRQPTPIVAYDISGNGQEIVYEAAPRASNSFDTEETRRNGVVISTQSPSDLFLSECNVDQHPDRADKELFLQHGRGTATRLFLSDSLSGYLPLSLSRTGRYAVLEAYVSDVPRSWSTYKDKLLHPYMIEQRKLSGRSNVTRYMLVDTANDEISPLLDAPISWFNNGLAWSNDGNSIVLSGTYLPLEVADPADREVRENHTFVVEVKLPSKEIVKITDQDLRIANWNPRTGRVLLEPGYMKKLPPEVYEKTGSTWKTVPLTRADMETGNAVDVSLEEDINRPPKIFVTELESHQKDLLLDLNPQFSQLQFGLVEPVSWKATDGHEVAGGLYLPPDYREGKKYPLVIQTHGFRKDRFWIDGPWSSVFAAQSLAAKGIVVLQVGTSSDISEDLKYRNTPDEAPRQMAAYEGAIDYLAKRDLIDRNRVGMVGFSRTAYYVAYTLTHSRSPFAAATLADGFDGGYLNVMFTQGLDYVAVNGGLPFGSSLGSWLKNSPGFNLDKVRTPVRLEYYGWDGFLGGWQWFSGLSFLKKPVDFVWLPDGIHNLIKPWERMVSQQGNVDWFVFWLNGVEDPKPAKTEQYERWEELRDLMNQNAGKSAVWLY